MGTQWTIWRQKQCSTPLMTRSQVQADTVDDTLGDLEAAQAQLDTVAEEPSKVDDVTQTDAIAVALAAKLAEEDAKVLVNTVANTLAKVKAVKLCNTLSEVQAH